MLGSRDEIARGVYQKQTRRLTADLPTDDESGLGAQSGLRDRGAVLLLLGAGEAAEVVRRRLEVGQRQQVARRRLADVSL